MGLLSCKETSGRKVTALNESDRGALGQRTAKPRLCLFQPDVATVPQRAGIMAPPARR
jgi:hypothetical protein